LENLPRGRDIRCRPVIKLRQLSTKELLAETNHVEIFAAAPQEGQRFAGHVVRLVMRKRRSTSWALYMTTCDCFAQNRVSNGAWPRHRPLCRVSQKARPAVRRERKAALPERPVGWHAGPAQGKMHAWPAWITSVHPTVSPTGVLAHDAFQ
jgi:hypothetical protein